MSKKSKHHKKGPKNPPQAPQQTQPKSSSSQETKTPTEQPKQEIAQPPPPPVVEKKPQQPPAEVKSTPEVKTSPEVKTPPEVKQHVVEAKPPPTPAASDKKEEQPPVKPKRHRNRKKKNNSESSDQGSIDEKSPEPEKCETKEIKPPEPIQKVQQEEKLPEKPPREKDSGQTKGNKKNVDFKEKVEQIPDKIEHPKSQDKTNKKDKAAKSDESKNAPDIIVSATVISPVKEDVKKSEVPKDIEVKSDEPAKEESNNDSCETKSNKNRKNKNKKPKDTPTDIQEKEAIEDIKTFETKAENKSTPTKENIKKENEKEQEKCIPVQQDKKEKLSVEKSPKEKAAEKSDDKKISTENISESCKKTKSKESLTEICEMPKKMDHKKSSKENIVESCKIEKKPTSEAVEKICELQKKSKSKENLADTCQTEKKSSKEDLLKISKSEIKSSKENLVESMKLTKKEKSSKENLLESCKTEIRSSKEELDVCKIKKDDEKLTKENTSESSKKEKCIEKPSKEESVNISQSGKKEENLSSDDCTKSQPHKDKKSSKKAQKSKDDKTLTSGGMAEDHKELMKELKHVIEAKPVESKPASKEESKDDMMDTLGSSIEESLKKLIVCESDLPYGEQLMIHDTKKDISEDKKEDSKHKHKKSKKDAKTEHLCETKTEKLKETEKEEEVENKTIAKSTSDEPSTCIFDKPQIEIKDDIACPLFETKVDESITKSEAQQKDDHDDKKHKKGKKQHKKDQSNIARTASPLPESKDVKNIDVVKSESKTEKVDDKTSEIHTIRSTVPEDIIQALLSDEPPKFIDDGEKQQSSTKDEKIDDIIIFEKKLPGDKQEVTTRKEEKTDEEACKLQEKCTKETEIKAESSEQTECHKKEKHGKHGKGKHSKHDKMIDEPIHTQTKTEIDPTQISDDKCQLSKEKKEEEILPLMEEKKQENILNVSLPAEEKITGSPKPSKKGKDKKHKSEKTKMDQGVQTPTEKSCVTTQMESKDSVVSSPTSEENFEIIGLSQPETSKETLKPDEPLREKSPLKQDSKNVHGHSSTHAKSSKSDFKKERNKTPTPDQAAELPKKDDSGGVVITEEACSMTLDDDEDTEFVYKYSFRVVHICNACQVCKVQLKDDRVVCRFCHLVGYCFEKHRDEDWSQHQTLCYAICTLTHVKGLEHIYADAKGMNGQDFRLLRMQAIVSCEKLLKRKLCPWEQEVLLYPRMCQNPSCREWRSELLKDCEKCGQVSYCITSPDHLDKSHEEWCSAYGLYHALVNHQLSKGRIEPILPSRIVESGFELPEKCSKLFEELYGCVINMDECHYATLTQLATAPLTALYACQKTMNKKPLKETFCVHVIGAELQFEADTPNKWEVFFLHLVPEVKELKIVFIGPELNVSKLPVELLTKIRMCPQCRFANRRVKFEFHDEILYHDFIETKHFSPPDLICAFNPGFHRLTGYAGLDTWPDTMRCALRLKVPLCCTSYTSAEAPRDISRIFECCGGPSAVKVLMEPKKNAYRSRRPDRNFVSDDDAPLIFKNYFISIVIAS